MAAELAGKTALVTGAASGIGRASALGFAQAGASVALVDIEPDGLEATAAAILAAGGEVEVITADITDLAAMERAVTRTVARFGSLDAAHNNAGVAGPFLPIDEYPPEEFHRVLQVDLVGVWHSMRAEIAQMRNQGSGAIVNTSSMLGDAAMPDNSAYIAAKHGVNGLTRAAALELASSGVRVNALAPGVTRTAMVSSVSETLLQSVPLSRLAEPSEIAAAAVWLCSPQASYVTGAVLVADGGWLAG
ncbi:MAG TPA: SDR family NAD(P)-dependent oxidoreductase [Jatrophihabitans sp.]